MSPRHFFPRAHFLFWVGSLNSQQTRGSFYPRWVFHISLLGPCSPFSSQPLFSPAWISDFLRAQLLRGHQGTKTLGAGGAAAPPEPSPTPERGADTSMGLQQPRTEPCVRSREQPSRQRGDQLPEDELGHGKGGACRVSELGAVWVPCSQEC